MRASLPATARLHRPSEYALALKGKRIARGALLVVTTPREAPQGASRARLGLIVAKRFAAKAVTRNTIKRVIRETFRKMQHELPRRDLVFRLHSKVGPLSLTELRALVRAEAEVLLGKARQ
ncbi:MAG TPA: ribonuclease P protein component [Pusillimonas sp.]